RASLRLWLWLPLGLVAAVGVGATLHAWLIPPASHLSVGTAPPGTVVSTAVQAPTPPAAVLPAAEKVDQAVAEPAPPAPDEYVLRPVSQLPPMATLSVESPVLPVMAAPAPVTAVVPV